MATHGSATVREETPHANETTTRTATIMNALRQRAESVLNDESLDSESRATIRYALETNDPWLAKLVRRAHAGKPVVDTIDFSQPRAANENDSSRKIDALVEIICASSDESAAALLVLMGIFQDSTDPQALANTAKHFAFTRCGELNLFGMVDAQIAVVEGRLLANNSLAP